MTTKPHRRNLVVRLFNEQAARCYYCGTIMTLHLGKPHTATLDHIVPRSQGGWLCVAAGYICNQSKSDSPAAVFMELVAAGKTKTCASVLTALRGNYDAL